MKRLILSLGLLVMLSVLSVSAQAFQKGDKVVNLGVGIGSTLYTGSGYSMSVPPLSGSFEYGIVDNLFDEKSSIGIGGYFGYTASKHKPGYAPYGYEYKYSSSIIGARGSFHYSFIEQLDTYTGLSLGYNIVSGKSDHKDIGSYSAKSSAFFIGWYAGARYYFTDYFAAMAEIGYDVAYLNIGVSFKF